MLKPVRSSSTTTAAPSPRLRAVLFGCALFALGGALLSVAVPVQAQDGSAEDDEAQIHFQLASTYYESGRFSEAAGEFQQAYDLSQRPALLYNIFLAWRDASELGPAIEALRAFLELGAPAPEVRVRLQSQLEGMERRYAEESQAEADDGPAAIVAGAAVAGSVVAGEPAPETTPDDAVDDQSDAEPTAESGGGVGVLPIILMATGGAMVVGGIITGVMAIGAENDLQEMCDGDGGCPPGFEDTRDSGQTLATVTDVLLIGGLVTAGVGVVLLALGVGSDDDQEPSLSFACTLDGCGGSARVPF